MALEISQPKLDSAMLVPFKGTVVAGNDTELLANKTEELLEAGETRIVLEMAERRFIGSTGIFALVTAPSSAARKNGSIGLLHLTKRIYDVLRITRLSSAFETYNNL